MALRASFQLQRRHDGREAGAAAERGAEDAGVAVTTLVYTILVQGRCVAVDAQRQPLDHDMPMNRAAASPHTRPLETPHPPVRSFRWHARLGLLLLGTALLTLSLAPIELYFLAWIGLVPWILVVAGSRSKKSAFAWGFIGGWLFFMTNMGWIWFVSPPGLFALTLYLATFWGLAGITIRSAILSPRSPIVNIALIATVWTAFEWLRGNVSFLGNQGLPWLYLGQSQSPILMMCQIADVTSVLGVTFWVALVNALVTIVVLSPRRLRELIPAIATVAVLLVGIGVYGAFRMSERTTYAGPNVLVIQSNYPQSNTGEKGAPLEQIVEFHVRATRSALRQCASQGQTVDLVVWSETMIPPINRSARDFARGTQAGAFWQRTADALSELAAESKTAMLVGGVFQDDWSDRDGYLFAADRRNSAFFVDSTGTLSDQRYDKMHLVPFGEYIPLESIPPIHKLFIKLGPNYYADYVLRRGTAVTVFSLDSRDDAGPVRFVVPICFEDIVPSLVACMLDDNGSKRADFLVNITNDGWFRGSQMPQHLQAALFRSIENRVPTARSVNTGISGFIDPIGRVGPTIAAGTEGFAVSRLVLDRRVAPYTRIGDVVPIACVVLSGAAVLVLSLSKPRDRTAE